MKVGKSKIKALVNSVPGEGSLPGLKMVIFLLYLKEKGGGGWQERERYLPYVSSYKGNNPIMKAPTSPNHFPKGPSPNTITNETLGFNIQIGG